MKTIKFIALALMLALGITAQAQNNVQWEGVAGMNVSNVDASGASSRIGFHLGARATFGLPSLTNSFYGNAAALLSLKGFKSGVTFNPFYLEVPVHLGYNYQASEALSLFADAGPYIGIGLFGKVDGHDVFSDEVGGKRFDVGLGVRAGVKVNNAVTVSAGYDFGLVDVADGADAKNRNFMLSVGYIIK